MGTRAGARWSREEVFQLLCTLNDNIEHIAPQTVPTDDNQMEILMKRVISEASMLLSRTLPFDITPSRVENKLSSLWANFGPPTGSKPPYALYQYGAFTKTLPGLEDPKNGFPGMLNEMAEYLKTQKPPSKSLQIPISQVQRKSERVGVRDDHTDPIVCRCGFSHHIACIHCDCCFTWQHTLCYYDTGVDDELPEKHMCDECLGVSTIQDDGKESYLAWNLTKAVRALRLESPKIDSGNHSEEKTVLAESEPGSYILGPFACPRDDDYFWGPINNDIRATMDDATSMTIEIAYSMLDTGLSIRRVNKTLGSDGGAALGNILEADRRRLCQNKLRTLMSQPTPKVGKIVRILAGLISEMVVNLTFYTSRSRAPSVDEIFHKLLLKKIMEQNGLQTLRDLRRNGLYSLIEKTNNPFLCCITEQATCMAEQVLKVLDSMMPTTSHERRSESEARQTALKQLFILMLRLRTHLALSERLYELRLTPIDTSLEGESMVDEMGNTIQPESTVETCLMPAVIEYELKNVNVPLEDFLLLSTGEIFLKESPESKPKGQVVSPAIVLVAS
ncbi:hypothetical protein PV08_07995 [Exophiala spinifera]|uniref:Zinc finger PHD-type domain-containing protein n=1 Tax=Exophiala spinifera TaxID=91928 RepID=A0A0D2B1J4_9EURO|nr:uncharacterized protein PV08_07995 [Exophiala spinifera]KIW12808.1 hypothetical protein PV08_07995 [Exophiala spinifera]